MPNWSRICEVTSPIRKTIENIGGIDSRMSRKNIFLTATNRWSNFLVAMKRLCKRKYLSVGHLVHPSICWSCICNAFVFRPFRNRLGAKKSRRNKENPARANISSENHTINVNFGECDVKWIRCMSVCCSFWWLDFHRTTLLHFEQWDGRAAHRS